MTRESVPRFDLYGELEVSRIASVGVIEAAYRSLVKQHHPDVAGSTDEARIKRLNLAREWLTDPVRRRRYDAATDPGALDPVRVMPRSGGVGAAGPAGATDPGSPRAGRSTGAASSAPGRAESSAGSAPSTFGINAPEVRRFLADLRGLDHRRAQEIWDGRAAAEAEGLVEARSAALAVAQSKRYAEWLLAREAASVIARGKLGGWPLAEPILSVVTDIAGAIAIRDLLPRRVFELLLLPWTWRGDPIVAGPGAAAAAAATAAATAAAAKAAAATAAAATAAASKAAAASAPASAASLSAASPWPAPPAAAAAAVASARPPAAASPSNPSGGASASSGAAMGSIGAADRRVRASNPRISTLTSLPALLTLLAVIAFGAGIASLNQPKPDIAVAGITDAPSQSSAPATVTLLPPASIPAPDTASPFASDPPTLVPTATAPGATSKPFVTFRPRPSRTPTPTVKPTASPTLIPTPVPTPTAAPTNTPTPTPSPAPTPTNTPTPTPSPAPTPSPPTMCTVPSLFNWSTTFAQFRWNSSGFTGTVLFQTPVPPSYTIKWQSLTAGTSALCSSGVTVDKVAP